MSILISMAERPGLWILTHLGWYHVPALTSFASYGHLLLRSPEFSLGPLSDGAKVTAPWWYKDSHSTLLSNVKTEIWEDLKLRKSFWNIALQKDDSAWLCLSWNRKFGLWVFRYKIIFFKNIKEQRKFYSTLWEASGEVFRFSFIFK